MIPDETFVDPATAVCVLVDAAGRADNPDVRRVLLALAVENAVTIVMGTLGG